MTEGGVPDDLLLQTRTIMATVTAMSTTMEQQIGTMTERLRYRGMLSLPVSAILSGSRGSEVKEIPGSLIGPGPTNR